MAKTNATRVASAERKEELGAISNSVLSLEHTLANLKSELSELNTRNSSLTKSHMGKVDELMSLHGTNGKKLKATQEELAAQKKQSTKIGSVQVEPLIAEIESLKKQLAGLTTSSEKISQGEAILRSN